MLGVLLAACGALLEEISSSIGKYAVSRHWEEPSMLLLLNAAWTFLYFAASSLFLPGAFVIASTSASLLGILVVLGGIQSIAIVYAIREASRSTYSLLRTLTVPMLALLDAFTGAPVSPARFFAIGLLYVATVWLMRNHGIERRGAMVALFTALNAAVTLWLFKQVLLQGTSVPAAQVVILAPLCVVLLCWVLIARPKRKTRGHTGVLIIQTASFGAATLVHSYALLFAPASVMIAALRSSAVLLSVASGNAVFHERHIKEKLIGAGVIMIGLAILAVG